MQNPRVERVTQELQQEVARILHREIKDPELGFVTVTRMELSKDLRHAKVWFSCLGSQVDREASQAVMQRSARYIHSLLKKRFRLKVIPELQFHYDASIEGSIAMSDTLDRLKAPPHNP